LEEVVVEASILLWLFLITFEFVLETIFRPYKFTKAILVELWAVRLMQYTHPIQASNPFDQAAMHG